MLAMIDPAGESPKQASAGGGILTAVGDVGDGGGGGGGGESDDEGMPALQSPEADLHPRSSSSASSSSSSSSSAVTIKPESN